MIACSEHVEAARLQEVIDLSGALERGNSSDVAGLLARCVGLCSRVSGWQWCIHGETVAFRKKVVEWLIKNGRYVLARRYALCGKGDLLLRHQGTGAARVRPMGCGAKFCPRCSRRSGRKHLARVAAHLSTSSHGSIWHVVLTQPGMVEESVGHAKIRFEKAWKRFYPTLRKAGLRSALATYHAKPNRRYGWHYHCHLVMEMDDVVDEETLYHGLNERWQEVVGRVEGRTGRRDVFMRPVVGPGPALVGMKANTQLDFWDEPVDQVEAVLHYLIRDVLQGVESWVKDLVSESEVFEFCGYMGTAKRHRTYGEWRKRVPEDGTESEAALEESGGCCEVKKEMVAGHGGLWSVVTTMDQSFRSLRAGVMETEPLVAQLIGKRNRSSGVLFRLKRLVEFLAL